MSILEVLADNSHLQRWRATLNDRQRSVRLKWRANIVESNLFWPVAGKTTTDRLTLASVWAKCNVSV